jgi:tetratricopeptide (TPR) repeat protein
MFLEALQEQFDNSLQNLLTIQLCLLVLQLPRPAPVDLVQLDAAIGELLRLSLLRRDANAQTLIMHNLVQLVIKDRIEDNAQRQWIDRVVKVLVRVFPTIEATDWQLSQRYLPQVQGCLTLMEQWQTVLPEGALLLERASHYLQEQKRYADGEPLLIRALSIRQTHLGSLHPDVTISLEKLAEIYQAQGKYSLAEPLLQQSLEIQRTLVEETHPFFVTALNRLAALYQVEGKYSQSEGLYMEVLEIRHRSLGEMHPSY